MIRKFVAVLTSFVFVTNSWMMAPAAWAAGDEVSKTSLLAQKPVKAVPMIRQLVPVNAKPVVPASSLMQMAQDGPLSSASISNIVSTSRATATQTRTSTVTATQTLIATQTSTGTNQAVYNSRPVADSMVASGEEDAVIRGQLAARDADGDPLTYILVDAPMKGIVVVNTDGSYVYTPNANENGEDLFTYKVNDGKIDSAAKKRVRLTIRSINDAPVVSSITHNAVDADSQKAGIQVEKGKKITLSGSASDVDGDALTWEWLYEPPKEKNVLIARGTGTINDVVFETVDLSGIYTLILRVSDGSLIREKRLQMEVVNPPSAPNRRPIGTSMQAEGNEDTVLHGQLAAMDPDGDPLTFRLVAAPTKGNLALHSDGSFEYTPFENQTGKDMFTYLVNDGKLDSVFPKRFYITLNPVNDAPVIKSVEPQKGQVGETLRFKLEGFDAEGTSLNFQELGTLPKGFTFDELTGECQWKPIEAGEYSVKFAVSDGQLLSKPIEIKVKVEPAQDKEPPQIANINVSDLSDSSATIQFATNEPATFVIEYGENMDDSSKIQGPSLPTMNHQIQLSNLKPGTKYYYRILAIDLNGNKSYSSELTFFSLGKLDTTPPLIANRKTTDLKIHSVVISWTTDEASDSQIVYGLDYDGVSFVSERMTPVDSAMVTSHSMTLSGLQASTYYYYQIRSRDKSGNLAVTYGEFETPAVVSFDITHVMAVDVLSTRSEIKWNTSVQSNSQVEYGLTTNYGSLSARSSEFVDNHKIELTALQPNTTYHYRVISEDEVGNKAFSKDYIFTTKPQDHDPPVIHHIIGDVALSEFSHKCYVDWWTNEKTYSWIEYGKTADYGSVAGQDNQFTIRKDYWMLSGLLPDTTYHYRIIAHDEVGNISRSNDFTLRTAPLEIGLNQFDADYTRDGFQVFTQSPYSKVTYSGAFSNAKTGPMDWTWSYRLNGGSETIYQSGKSSEMSIAIDYATMSEGRYDWVLRYYDGFQWKESKIETEALKGTWSSNNVPTIFLDMDGNYAHDWISSWRETEGIDLDQIPDSFTMREIIAAGKVLMGVAEKFSPFNIGVSLFDHFISHGQYQSKDEESKARYDFYEKNNILQVAIGETIPDLTDNGKWGGKAKLRNYADEKAINLVYDMSLFDFYDIVRVAPHEVGHAFGLYHQSLYDGSEKLVNEYYGGEYDESAKSGWSPIMGSGAERRVWWTGEGNMPESRRVDEMAIIASKENGFGYRPDDHGNAVNAGSALHVLGDNVTGYGIVNKMDDADYFDFTTTKAGEVSFTVSPPEYGMLDALVEIRDAQDRVIKTVDAKIVAPETISVQLQPGTYYLVVKSHGRYGDVGQYWINGKVPVGTMSLREANALGGEQNVLVPVMGIDPIFSDYVSKP